MTTQNIKTISYFVGPTKYEIQKRLEKETGGTEETCIHGVVDIVSSTQIIQIREWKHRKEALGNILMCMDCFKDKIARVHFFGEKPIEELRNHVSVFIRKLML